MPKIITCQHGVRPKGKCQECTRERNREGFYRWMKAHPETKRENDRRWKQEHPEQHAENTRKWHQKHPDQSRATWHNSRAKRLGIPGTITAAQWAWLKRTHKFTCLACHRREPDIRLTPDHIKPLSKGGTNYIWNIQPLCGTCNDKKGTREIDYRRNP